MDLRPAIVFPLHDPDGCMAPRLRSMLPALKETFGEAYVVVTAPTHLRHPQNIHALEPDPFFHLSILEESLPVGEQFARLYRLAAAQAPADQILHLAFLDRLAYALLTEQKDSFLADVDASNRTDLPRLYLRSEKAWATHPANYAAAEHFLTRAGEALFGVSLDYAWCHLALLAGQLAQIMPRVHHSDMSMLAEMMLLLRASVTCQEVDWLAWEDPFIFGRDAEELKREREQSIAETRRRLAYVIPMLKLLAETAERDAQP